tara:strand:+ start:139 stop:378 length:240 start_codon:yes stop_codon:yes gene_type:complete
MFDDNEGRGWERCSNSSCRNRAIISKSFDDDPPKNYCVECYDVAGLNAALKWNYAQNPPLDTLEKRKEYVSKGLKLKRI